MLLTKLKHFLGLTFRQLQTILLTGGTGYLGKHLAALLLKKRHKLILLKRKTSILPRILEGKTCTFDIEDGLERLFEEFSQIDVIIHMATCYGRNNEKEAEIKFCNYELPRKLINIAAVYKVDSFINIDTMLAKNINNYSFYKHKFKDSILKKHFSNRIKIFNIRPQIFYGAFDDQKKITSTLIRNCILNKKELNLTKGEQERDFIYIDDVVSAIYKIIIFNPNYEKGFYDFEVGSGEAFTLKEFALLTKKLSKSKTKLNFGVLPYRKNEIMTSKADNKKIYALGWKIKKTLSENLAHIIELESAFYKKNNEK
jgi:CDP-paratose synthetase